jgi:hypothetical protein
MKNRTNIFLTLLFVSLLSCEKEESNNVEIMPIAEGNSWTYQNVNHSYNEIDTSIIGIGKKISISGHEGNLFGTSYIIRSDDQGNTIQVGAFSEHDTVFTESIIYKCNINKGESFDYHMIISSSNSLDFEELTVSKTCLAVDTLISTSAGDFKCIVFEHSPDNGCNVFKDYMCKNVGRIKSERFEDGRLFSSSILIKYQLK